jgi:hypothetical protein
MSVAVVTELTLSSDSAFHSSDDSVTVARIRARWRAICMPISVVPCDSSLRRDATVLLHQPVRRVDAYILYRDALDAVLGAPGSHARGSKRRKRPRRQRLSVMRRDAGVVLSVAKLPVTAHPLTQVSYEGGTVLHQENTSGPCDGVSDQPMVSRKAPASLAWTE